MISLGALASLAALALGAQQRPQPTATESPSGEDLAAETLAALIEEAENNNPEIWAAMRSAEAAAARVPQAGALPDPILGVAMMNFPVAAPSLSREMMTMTMLQVTESFPFPGKLGLREGIADFLSQAAEWEVEHIRREVIEGVKSAFYHVYFIDRALDITRRNRELLADFASLTSVRYAVGSVGQPDVLKARVEQTGLEDELVALRERRSSAVAGLNALLDRPLQTLLSVAELPVSVRAAALEGGERTLTFAAVSFSGVNPGGGREPAPGIRPLEELQRVAAENNPRIRTHALRVRAQEEMLSLAEKAVLPDFNVAVAYGRRSGFSDFLSVSVSVPLPVFSGRKQNQGVLEQTGVLERLRARLRAVHNEVDQEIAILVASLARARDQLTLLDDGILPQARTTLSSATASYQVGSVDFLMLLDAQVTLYRHELEYHRLLADFAESVASLERVVGTEVLR